MNKGEGEEVEKNDFKQVSERKTFEMSRDTKFHVRIFAHMFCIVPKGRQTKQNKDSILHNFQKNDWW